ncbi:SDR family oxidoreductase [Streptomyces sp. 3214.6]|uniref:SDR family oxidoreductase n=1 Tax=Streptomyces sp. 3214.6 TaxID=1882757 RepID=UPI0018D4E5BF|nr:SDR family oxidoreductase [Streptomyces sp. 3214.6]
MTTSVRGATAFITGANGGLGQHWVRETLARGARRVYASDITIGEWDDERVVPLVVDVTKPETIDAAAEAATDVTLLINNAGIGSPYPMTEVSAENLRRVFDIDFFGPVAVTQRFAPILKKNGGGAVITVVSVLSWVALSAGYSAAKAALYSANNSFRLELAGQGTHVLSLQMAHTDTPMTAALDVPNKNDPAEMITLALDGFEAGEQEVLADELTRQVKAALALPVREMYALLEAAAPR